MSGVPIFVEQWGDNFQFYPNFTLFSTFGGMNLDHDFFQVSKLAEDQKKGLHENFKEFFFPNSNEDQKKDLQQNFRSFSSNSSDADQIQVIHVQTRVKLLGGYISPIPPGFGTPDKCIA